MEQLNGDHLTMTLSIQRNRPALVVFPTRAHEMGGIKTNEVPYQVYLFPPTDIARDVV